MSESLNDIMTLNEFADYIRVHPNTVRKMIKTGQLAYFKSGSAKNSGYRIARSETLRMSLMFVDILKEKK